MKIFLSIVIITLLLPIEGKYFRKFYKKAQQIVDQLTLDQKIGQMSQVDIASFNKIDGTTDPSNIQKYFLGSIHVGGTL